MKKAYIVLLILLLIVTGVVIFVASKSNKQINQNDFKIYFFNAGKADACIISKDGYNVMIDTGEDDLLNSILLYFKNNNIEKLDYLIITHFDKDHVGSASGIIDNIEVLNVLQSNSPKESEYYNDYINSLTNKNIEAKTISGDFEFNLGDLKFVVNGPDKIYEKDESNNSSLITSLVYKNTKYIFMGDAQNDRLKDFISNNFTIYDFVKIPYHGNYQKQLENLLNNIQPEYAVITSSFEEIEDDKMIDLLESINIKYYLTRNGGLTIYSDGEKIEIEQ